MKESRGRVSNRAAVVRASVRPVVEGLEGRQFFAAQLGPVPAALVAGTGGATTRDLSASNPSVLGLTPAAGATNVARDATVKVNNLSLPNGGLDGNTVKAPGAVTLVRASDGAAVPGTPDSSGGGDAITFTPHVRLDANTTYRFAITATVTDQTGAAFVPFTSTFTTGTAGGPVSSAVAFATVQQPTAQGEQFTGVTVGPDGKLYAGTYDGQVYRWTVGADGTLGSPQVINTVNAENASTRTITGIVFGPANGAAGGLAAYVTHSVKAEANGPNFTGKVTRLSGANLELYEDLVVQLPRSVRDHLTNQAAFGRDGALYVAQGSINAMGAPDLSWGLNSRESLLSAAILRLDVNKINQRLLAGQGPLNVKTVDAGGAYNPYAAGAALTLYATGVRNGYDLVWHSNGQLYTAVNGSAAGGNTPASSNTGRRPPIGAAYAGPAVPALSNVRQVEHDWLFRVAPGGYYGHPNPSRGQFVFNGGNPNPGADPQEVSAYPVGTQPDANYKRPAYDFGTSNSPDGMIEYRSGTFAGALKGKLLVVRYAGGDDIVALSPRADGSIDATKTMTGVGGIAPFTDPVDLTEYVNPANPTDPRNGMLFVAEYGGKRITLLRPAVSAGGGGAGPATVTGTAGTKIQLSRGALVFNAVRGKTSGTAKLTIKNTGTSALSVTGLTLGGSEPGAFLITGKGGLPGSLAAGASATVSVVYKPAAGAALGIHTATLTVASNDPSRGSIAVGLRGLATAGTGGQNEASLQRLFDLYQLGLATGDKNPANTNLFSPAEPLGLSDEVFVQRLQKAGAGSVTVQALGTFAGGSPAAQFGWYAAGNAAARTQVLSINAAEAQSVNLNPVGASTFDPGSGAFGLYVQFPIFNNTAYSEDGLNRGEQTVANRRKVRFYPLKNANGSVVADAYVFTSEDFVNDPAGGYDTNDFIGIVRNVRPAAAGGVTLTNLDGVPFDDRLVFNRISVQPPEQLRDGDGVLYNPPPNVVHDTASVRVTNGTGGPVTIGSTALSNNAAWTVVSGPAPGTVLAPGQSATVKLRFVATTPPPTDRNETIDPDGGSKTANGTYAGTLTVNTTAGPRVVTLRGYFQLKNEKDQEPNLATTINRVFGYGTQVIKAGETTNQGGRTAGIGEEILSGYWVRADAAAPVAVRQLAAYHTQGDTATLNWFDKATGAIKAVTTHNGVDAQSLLPRNLTGGPAAGTFNPSAPFGFRVANERSDDALNKQENPGGGWGHHMRFWPARDAAGGLIKDTYIMGMDYLGLNYDYQDNLYVISNIKAANGAVPSAVRPPGGGGDPGGGGGPVDPGGEAPVLGGLVLLNAATDAEIGAFGGGAALDVSGGRQYTVRADPGTGTLGSVVFALDGAVVRTESFAPYSAAGEVGTDFTPWDVPAGAHTLVVTPYTGSGGTGTAGTPISVDFTVTDDGGGPTDPFGVAGLTLFDAATDAAIGPVADGTVLDLSGGRQYAVRADVTGATRSVVFRLDGTAVRTESSAPFSLGGDVTRGDGAIDYAPWTGLTNGAHTLAVTGYTATGGAGAAGAGVSYAITVVGATTAPGPLGTLTGSNLGGATGSTVPDGTGTWVVKGSGRGVGGTADQAHYAQQAKAGDFDFRAKLTSLTGGQAGLTIRGGASGGNSQVTLLFSNGAVGFGSRTAFGAAYADTVRPAVAGAGSLWLRVKRVGSAYSGYMSANGTTWTFLGTLTVSAMPDAVTRGFVVASGTTGLATARFEGAAG